MLTIATTVEEATQAAGEIRAGGTDVQERRRAGLSHGPLVDIHKVAGLDQIESTPSGTTIGALVKIDTAATDPHIVPSYAGLAQAAAGLATPQIRWMGTMGGALLQKTRCHFFRHPAYSCYKSGGDDCPAREGHNPNGVVFDLGPCVFPHPATLGMALLAYEAEVEI
ncbi:MAG: FAD binding domain-containing protein, partial [Anaerolineales bacterium]|nr:FAD binding domain-containing protein [Anaerolineales bacterium]